MTSRELTLGNQMHLAKIKKKSGWNWYKNFKTQLSRMMSQMVECILKDATDGHTLNNNKYGC